MPAYARVSSHIFGEVRRAGGWRSSFSSEQVALFVTPFYGFSRHSTLRWGGREGVWKHQIPNIKHPPSPRLRRASQRNFKHQVPKGDVGETASEKRQRTAALQDAGAWYADNFEVDATDRTPPRETFHRNVSTLRQLAKFASSPNPCLSV